MRRLTQGSLQEGGKRSPVVRLGALLAGVRGHVELALQIHDLTAQRWVLLKHRANFLAGVHGCGVVFLTKAFPDVWKGAVGYMGSAEIHGNLSWSDDCFLPCAALEVRNTNLKVASDEFLNGIEGDGLGFAGHDVSQDPLRVAQIDGGLGE